MGQVVEHEFGRPDLGCPNASLARTFGKSAIHFGFGGGGNRGRPVGDSVGMGAGAVKITCVGRSLRIRNITQVRGRAAANQHDLWVTGFHTIPDHPREIAVVLRGAGAPCPPVHPWFVPDLPIGNEIGQRVDHRRHHVGMGLEILRAVLVARNLASERVGLNVPGHVVINHPKGFDAFGPPVFDNLSDWQSV